MQLRGEQGTDGPKKKVVLQQKTNQNWKNPVSSQNEERSCLGIILSILTLSKRNELSRDEATEGVLELVGILGEETDSLLSN